MKWIPWKGVESVLYVFLTLTVPRFEKDSKLFLKHPSAFKDYVFKWREGRISRNNAVQITQCFIVQRFIVYK